tara:strand:+ start:3817 stop:6153 length:2337 start_codon:yes stop_codon:yes gene_type:complete
VLFLVFPEYFLRLAELYDWIPSTSFAVDPEQYTALMNTVAQASAAMLALFFAAISVVASTAYANVATEIRSLIPQDDLNRRYLSLLAHTAATSTIGIAVQSFGGPNSSILAAYVVLLILISLLAFLPLGIRTFDLFDPATLTGYPSRTFESALQSVIPDSRNWLDPSFQQYANRRATEQLELLEELLVFSIAQDHSHHETVVDIATRMLRLTSYYAGLKPSIPTDSRWFARKAEFKRWDIASSSLTELAFQTGVQPSPDSVPDHGFVETTAIEMTTRCLRHLLDHEALDDVVRLLLEVNRTVSAQCTMFDSGEAARLISSTREILVEHLRRTDESVLPLKHLQMVDVFCVAGLAPILSASQALTHQGVPKLLSIEESVRRLDCARNFRAVAPRKVIKTHEDLSRRIEFEKSAEGETSTPAWYVKQILASAYAEEIRDIILSITENLETEFVQAAAELVGENRPVWAGVWLQRSIEACKKATDGINRLDEQYEQLYAYHITEAPWFPSGSKEALNRIEASRIKVLRNLAAIVPRLCQAPVVGNLPDLVGQTRAWLAEELVSMMANRQEDGFEKLFAAYFGASITVYGHYAELAREPGQNDNIRVAMSVYLDMMEISGLALIFSELDSTKFKSVVCNIWDATLDSADNPEAVIRALYSTIDNQLILPFLSPGAMQRSNWSRLLSQALTERGIDMEKVYGSPWSDSPRKPNSNAVIESVTVVMGHSISELYKYFGVLYLSIRPEASEIEFPSALVSCKRSIELAKTRITEFYKNENNETTE